MAKTHNKLPVLKDIVITDMAAEGKAIAKVDNLVVFVPYVIPGDVVDLQLTKQKKRFAEAKVIGISNYSKQRIEPRCQHYGVCGGCQWQVLPYETQLSYKDKQVNDHLKRIGKVDLPEALPILGSQETWFYRNKLEFSFASQSYQKGNQSEKVLGFHLADSFKHIVPIETCYLQSELSNQIRVAVFEYADNQQLSFWDYQTKKGLLRSLVIRQNLLGQVMLTIVCQIKNQRDKQSIEDLLLAMSQQFADVVATFYVDNPNADDYYGNLHAVHVCGEQYLREQMEDLEFAISPKSFYQTNGKQAEVLYRLVRDMAGLTGQERVYDLYTGTGTIALFVAKLAKEVIGIEYVADAIEDAKVNAKNNNINHAKFFAGDMKAVLTPDFIEQHGQPDVVITDPPRAGMHSDVIQVLLDMAPNKIVYVSCNPATQARDLQLLDAGYRIVKTQAVDMFPQTYHAENVVLLEKR